LGDLTNEVKLDVNMGRVSMLAAMTDDIRIGSSHTREKTKQAKETVGARWQQVVERNGLHLRFPPIRVKPCTKKKEDTPPRTLWRNPFKPLKRPAPPTSSSPLPPLPLKKARKADPPVYDDDDDFIM
jgi:hypothetical protein